ncbi:MAG: hypothetical protein AAFQ52_12270, partial [Chloroflexota bacterium]
EKKFLLSTFPENRKRLPSPLAERGWGRGQYHQPNKKGFHLRSQTKAPVTPCLSGSFSQR